MKKKERIRKRKGEEQERRRIFYNGCFGQNCVDAKGPFGGNLFKNPARYKIANKVNNNNQGLN